MSGRSHDIPHFYKYATRDTALHVIKTRSFRWSDPTLFNDPFDHQIGFVLDPDFEPAQFAKLLTASTERRVFGDALPRANPPSRNTQMILKMRSIRDRLPRQAFLKDMHQGSIEMAHSMLEKIGDLNASLQQQLCQSRVFCVTEGPDNVVMWSHYADEHRGVVFILRCDDELDNRLLAAQKVEYTDKFLTFPSVEAYAKHLTGEEPFDLVPLIWKIVVTKHKDWSYEREWRVHLPLLDESPGEVFSILVEDSRIFEAVYLGCRMPEQDIDSIKDALRNYLPDAKVFQARRSDRSFSLEFES